MSKTFLLPSITIKRGYILRHGRAWIITQYVWFLAFTNNFGLKKSAKVPLSDCFQKWTLAADLYGILRPNRVSPESN